MPLEYEYRYQDGRFDKNMIRNRLKELGAVKHGHWLFRVQVFTNPLIPSNPYVRVRDEGHKITLTYKTKGTNEFINELEVNINDFNTGVDILIGLGCVKRYYYEKLREIWHLGDTEVCWDTNPGRPDIMEIEAKSKKDLEKIVELLNLKDVSHDDFKEMELYEKPFGIVIPHTVDLTFNTVKKILGKYCTKNKKEFEKLVGEQIKKYKEVLKLNKKNITKESSIITNKSIKKSSKKSIKKSSKKSIKKSSNKSVKKSSKKML
jgi:predicted adenylyl cyclase CyaB